MVEKETSHWWWFDSHNSSRRSPWLQSTLAELDAKTKAMLKLIEEDADSFAQRAEMYYKKRPELISMVEDFYRAHRSLAERYDQAKSDHGTRVLTTLGSPFSSTKYHSEKLTNVMDQNYDSYSETFESEEYAESEVEDPEEEDETHVDKESKEAKDTEHDDGSQFEGEIKEHEVSSVVRDDEVMKLREGIERLKEENETQKEQLMQKDEEKREMITQLSLADDEVMKLRDEIERLKEMNKTQKEQLIQKDEEKREVITQLSLAIETHVDKESKEAKNSEHDNGSQFEEEIKEHEFSSVVCDDEVMKLREEIERLKEENKTQKEQLMQKEEEKREVIRQLSLAVETHVDKELKEAKNSEHDDGSQFEEEIKEPEVSSVVRNDEVMKLRGKIQRLKEENNTQKEQLMQKDEEKREVIRQLSLAVEVLKDDNLKLRKCISKDFPKKWSPFEFSKLKEGFLGKLFNGYPKPQTSILAL